MIETPLRIDVGDPSFLAGAVEGCGVTIAPSDDTLRSLLDEAIRRSAGGDSDVPPERKKAVRDLLRRGGFKPAGRNKPASEYLAACASKGDFPSINNIVDINNLVSLRFGLPISVIDLDLALPEGGGLILRLGGTKESYIFNNSGQEIEFGGLISLARNDSSGTALANPVKDSMLSKTWEGTRNVLAVIYGGNGAATRSVMEEASSFFADLLAQHAGAERTGFAVLPEE